MPPSGGIHEINPNRKRNTMDNFTAVMIAEQNWDLAGVEPDLDLFLKANQHLINNGMAWSLQGFFGRQAKSLIDQGLCTPSKG